MPSYTSSSCMHLMFTASVDHIKRSHGVFNLYHLSLHKYTL